MEVGLAFVNKDLIMSTINFSPWNTSLKYSLEVVIWLQGFPLQNSPKQRIIVTSTIFLSQKGSIDTENHCRYLIIPPWVRLGTCLMS